MSESQSSLEDELRQEDEEYRYAYAEDFLNTSVATQIRVLRDQRGLTQEELAQKIGTKQAGVSRLENVNYSAWKTETLRKIARALKVRLKITFETFGSLLDEAEAFSRENLERPSFDDDPTFRQSESETEHATANQTVLEEIPVNLRKKATGDDRQPLQPSLELLNKILRPSEYNNVIRFPIERRRHDQHEEPQYEALSNISR